jgi:nucleoside-diphosphate-sugar epimerase
MRVFVTGATGFIGSAVVKELLEEGHQVLGLTRSDAGAATLNTLGAQVQRGDLENLESLRTGAANADAVIHTAFVHDFDNFQKSCDIDLQAIETMVSVLEGSNRPFLVSTGSGMLAHGRIGTEEDAVDSPFPRVASDHATEAAATRGIRAAVVRLPATVHGHGDHAFIPQIIEIARQKGVSAYVGNGDNRWPAVHRLDAARLYALAVEKVTPGARYHAIAEEGIPFRQIAEVIGRRLNLPTVSIPPEQAMEHFGFFGRFAAADLPVSSHITRQRLGWNPTERGLIADLDDNHYFQS